MMDTNPRPPPNQDRPGFSLRGRLVESSTPAPQEMQVWRRQLVDGILRAVLIAAALSIVSGSFYAYSIGALWLIPLYVGICGIIALITFWSKVPYSLQAGIFLAAIYAIVIMDLVESGRTGSARVILATLPVIAILLFDLRAGVIALVVSFLTTVCFGWLYSTGHLTALPATSSSTNPAVWASNTAILLMVSTLLMVSANYLVTRLSATVTRLETSIGEREKLLSLQQATFEATADGILVVDRNGRIATYNQRFIDMWRIPDSVMASGQAESALEFVLEQLKDPDAFQAQVKKLYSQPEAESYDVLEFEDGRVYERHSKPQRLGEEIVGRVWDFRDITERRQAEESLKRRQRELESLLDTSRDILSTLNLDDVLSLIARRALSLLESGQCTIFRLEEDSITLSPIASEGAYREHAMSSPARIGEGITGHAVQQNQAILVNDARLDPRAKRIMEALPEGREHLMSAPLVSRGSTIGAMTVNRFSEQTFTEENLNLFVGFARQVAIAIENARLYQELEAYSESLERAVAERTAKLTIAYEQLKDLSQVKDEFVANVSHELRTPITSLKLRHHLLTLKPGEFEKHLDVARRETKRLERIVEDLLHLSRMDQERVELNPTSVDLNTLAEQYADDRIPLAEEKGLTLSLSEQAGLPLVQADEGLLGQALSILLTNALNYTPSGGQVMVRVQARQAEGKQWAGFSVSDTGPGIPPNEQPRLFERFFRGVAGRASGLPGTGLGLAIAKEIVERHQGRIEVTSEPGKGTIFSAWLPCAAREE